MKTLLLLSVSLLSQAALAGGLKTASIHGTSAPNVALKVITHYAAQSTAAWCQEHSFTEPPKAKIYYEEKQVPVSGGGRFAVSFAAKADSCDYRISTVGIYIEDKNCDSVKPAARRCYDGIRLSEGAWGNRPLVSAELASCRYLSHEGSSYFTCATKAFPNPDVFHDGGFNALHQYRLPTGVASYDLRLDVR